MKNSTARRYSTPDADTPEVSGGRLRLTVMPREMLDRVSLADLADEKLFERYQDGDESAFSLIVQRYEPLIKGFLFKRLKDEERLQDLTQDTFLRVHRARDRYDSARKFSTWIYTIASNLLKNEYRNRSRRRETPFSELRKESQEQASSRPVEFESDVPDPEQIAYQGELRTAISETIGRMDEHHRVPFVMREVEDLTYEEISAAIGVPVGTVKSRLFRARSSFQTLFPVPV
ncbi:sigma-70 family RNA polymerase sigma factor [soil metagenome]